MRTVARGVARGHAGTVTWGTFESIEYGVLSMGKVSGGRGRDAIQRSKGAAEGNRIMSWGHG